MNCIISIPQEAYDLIMGKTDAANLDLYSTLIQSVKNGTPIDGMIGTWIEIDKDMYACSICSHCISIVPEDNRIEQFENCPFCGKPMKTELKQKEEKTDDK